MKELNCKEQTNGKREDGTLSGAVENEKKKTWREECREYGCLIGGFGKITYELDGKQKREKIKFVGKFWHIDELDRTDEDPYFKGVIFDMYNNEQGSVSWTKKEFLAICESFSELF